MKMEAAPSAQLDFDEEVCSIQIRRLALCLVIYLNSFSYLSLTKEIKIWCQKAKSEAGDGTVWAHLEIFQFWGVLRVCLTAVLSIFI